MAGLKAWLLVTANTALIQSSIICDANALQMPSWTEDYSLECVLEKQRSTCDRTVCASSGLCSCKWIKSIVLSSPTTGKLLTY